MNAAIAAADIGSNRAPFLAFGAGALTSIGPCVAPRLVAVAAICTGQATPLQRGGAIASLVAGLCCAYVAIGICASLLRPLIHSSTAVYLACSAAFLFGGVRSVLAGSTDPLRRCGTSCCEEAPMAVRSYGMAFLQGCSFGLVVSPCCMPIIAVATGLSFGLGSWPAATAILAAFAFGHALPLIGFGLGLGGIRRWLVLCEGPLALVSGGLLIALSVYYVALA